MTRPDHDDEELDPTLHRCASGCGWLVRSGEPHVCDPACNCRPRTRAIGVAWQHVSDCPHGGPPDENSPHACEHCTVEAAAAASPVIAGEPRSRANAAQGTGNG